MPQDHQDNPQPPRTLEATLDAARDELITVALTPGHDPYLLAAHAQGVATIQNMIPTPAPQPDPAVLLCQERHERIEQAATRLLDVFDDPTLTREHFTGVYEPLLKPLEELGLAIDPDGDRLQ